MRYMTKRRNTTHAKTVRGIAIALVTGVVIGVSNPDDNANANLEARIAQVEEISVQHDDATRATIACLRIIDTPAYSFDGGMAQCIDDWFEGNAKGDF